MCVADSQRRPWWQRSERRKRMWSEDHQWPGDCGILEDPGGVWGGKFQIMTEAPNSTAPSEAASMLRCQPPLKSIITLLGIGILEQKHPLKHCHSFRYYRVGPTSAPWFHCFVLRSSLLTPQWPDRLCGPRHPRRPSFAEVVAKQVLQSAVRCRKSTGTPPCNLRLTLSMDCADISCSSHGDSF